MAALPHPPQLTWLQRISFALAVALCLLGMLALANGFLHTGTHAPEIASLKANMAFALLALGVVLLLIELGSAKVPWLALLPALIGALTLIEHGFHANLGVDELLMRDYAFID
ncbi:MAG TPA: hypothetical protein VNW23_09165, partial [Opitutaceae bacterium]|nr:hypothetical protein [Opitutaceae bacterium]